MLFLMLQRNFLCCSEMVGSFWEYFVLLINLVSHLLRCYGDMYHTFTEMVIIYLLQPMLFLRGLVRGSLLAIFIVTSLWVFT